jgi:hypothetical protein
MRPERDLQQSVSPESAKDLSPEIKRLVKEMETLRTQNQGGEKKGLGVTDRPAAGGPMGEDKAGGAGPIGPRALPPGPAPGFEDAGKKISGCVGTSRSHAPSNSIVADTALKCIAMLGVLSWPLWWPSLGMGEQVIQQVSDYGSRTLEPITVKDNWEIRWDFEGSLFQVFVNKLSGPLPDLPVDGTTQEGSGRGSYLQAKGGTYYLKVRGLGHWTVTVVQLP